MAHVPCAGDAIVGAVLAHRGDDDAVRQLDTGELQRRKQSTHGAITMCGLCWKGKWAGRDHREHVASGATAALPATTDRRPPGGASQSHLGPVRVLGSPADKR